MTNPKHPAPRDDLAEVIAMLCGPCRDRLKRASDAGQVGYAICETCQEKFKERDALAASGLPKHPAPWKWEDGWGDDILVDANGGDVGVRNIGLESAGMALLVLAPEMEAMLRRAREVIATSPRRAEILVKDNGVVSCPEGQAWNTESREVVAEIGIILARIDKARKGT